MSKLKKNTGKPEIYYTKKMIKDCRHIRKHAIALIEEGLTSPMREQMLEHIQTCSSCQLLFHDLRQTYRILDNIKVGDPGPFFHTRVAQRFENHLTTGDVYFSRILRPIAIGLLTGAGIFVGVLIGRSIAESSINISSSSSNEALGSYATDYYLTGSGEESLEILVNNE